MKEFKKIVCNKCNLSQKNRGQLKCIHCDSDKGFRYGVSVVSETYLELDDRLRQNEDYRY